MAAVWWCGDVSVHLFRVKGIYPWHGVSQCCLVDCSTLRFSLVFHDNTIFHSSICHHCSLQNGLIEFPHFYRTHLQRNFPSPSFPWLDGDSGWAILIYFSCAGMLSIRNTQNNNWRFFVFVASKFTTVWKTQTLMFPAPWQVFIRWISLHQLFTFRSM